MEEPTYKVTVDEEAKSVKILFKLPGAKAAPNIVVDGSRLTLEGGKFFIEVRPKDKTVTEVLVLL
jgi:hypothetical protein